MPIEIHHALLIISGLLFPIITGLWAIWRKSEHEQNERITALHQENNEAHALLHGKIDKVKDKIEDIWKHLVKSGQ